MVHKETLGFFFFNRPDTEHLIHFHYHLKKLLQMDGQVKYDIWGSKHTILTLPQHHDLHCN